MTNGIEGREEVLWALLTRRMGLWTGLDHSSVTAERAQAILDSTLFTLGLGEEALAGETLPAAGLVSLEQLFALGQRRIRSQLRVSRGLWRRVRDTLPPTNNRCCRETLIDGMAAFFRRYEPEFSATDHIITCDYPLALPVVGMEGVTLIETYLERALWENQFCACFSPLPLQALWKRRGIDAEAFCNLFEPVLTAALGCVLTGEDPLCLAPSLSGAAALQSALLGRSRSEVEALTVQALDALTGGLDLRKPGLLRYLGQAAGETAAGLFHAVENLTVARFLGAVR